MVPLLVNIHSIITFELAWFKNISMWNSSSQGMSFVVIKKVTLLFIILYNLTEGALHVKTSIITKMSTA